MEYDLKYNEQPDEFAIDLTIQSRLRKYVNKHFYPAFAISMLCPIYLMGGAIRDLLMAKKPKDLDFVIVGEEYKEWVLKVFKKFNIDYTFNRLGGFSINYQETKIV